MCLIAFLGNSVVPDKRQCFFPSEPSNMFGEGDPVYTRIRNLLEQGRLLSSVTPMSNCVNM